MNIVYRFSVIKIPVPDMYFIITAGNININEDKTSCMSTIQKKINELLLLNLFGLYFC